ncbi:MULTISPECIES: tetratricopeptide repeat protein [unclassified Janthinobacterium]|uniref:YfgM family protein n=1 Tax=unclassified Janthinobacterium TaxID=2610881 RepID=UPI00160A6680|nr:MULTISPECIES: tetratricopeptide repeat protein [unclassified Janthinobacterium]MBB5607659.1 putative negative regulator of RcsB-dependent stress response [Janthinobacterium sp. S3T4]MBB5613193.1 putative negative regulator of RcsB-dependent stress response [Janthinobacterium sp. S3M3]
MAYDHEEQEQLATLKAWWQRNGNLTSWVLIVALAAYSGWAGWQYYQRTQAAQAGQLYDELQNAIVAKDNAKVQRAASDMQSRFSRTAYAQMASLAAAKTAFDANDLKAAKTQLQWVADHGAEEYKVIAQLRLAGVLMDEKSYDEALKVLASANVPQFAGAVADRKGDILVAQNKLADARTAYLAALAATAKDNPGRQLIQIKLEAIGGTVPEDTAKADQAAA